MDDDDDDNDDDDDDDDIVASHWCGRLLHEYDVTWSSVTKAI